MKLFHKIFICFVIIFGITFQMAGYLLIDFAYENALEQEKGFAFQEFQYNKYILQSLLYSEPELSAGDETGGLYLAERFAVPVAVCDAEGRCIYSDLNVELPADFMKTGDDRISWQIFHTEAVSCILAYTDVHQGSASAYLITERDIGSLVNTQHDMIVYFQKIYLLIMGIGFPVILLLTKLLVGSINRVGKAARRIAEGRYTERIGSVGHDEIGELAADFNQMAEKVEEKIAELSGAAKRQEDFTANFAHELKTPLTSVIGYADMLYQRDLSREQVQSAAVYILNEGMRLEALSLKLMDMFVLNKQDFSLEKMSIREMSEDLEQGLNPVCQKYNVKLRMDMEEGYIAAEYDLFKTMMFNLVDNAAKADSRNIVIAGRRVGNIYRLCLEDDGKGIPRELLGRITEAFYMVDKSRARKQHGAGLGLALVARIVELHEAKMRIFSDGKKGTRVELEFALVGGREGMEDE